MSAPLACPNCKCALGGGSSNMNDNNIAMKIADPRSEQKINRQKATVTNCHGKMRTLESEIKGLVTEKESLLNLLMSIKARVTAIDTEYDQKQREYSSLG